MTFNTSGAVAYTTRAFEQDGQQALRGDIIRGLIELITNCDDAYGKNEGGTIRIEFSKSSGDTEFSFEVKVRDSAKGMDAKTMHDRLTVLGGSNSQFMQDEGARGLLGRGAKDVASLGAVVFESVKNGKYSKMTLSNTGQYNFEAVDVDAEKEHYELLKLDNGTNGVTVTVKAFKNITLPKNQNISRKLQTNVQLRELLHRREVLFLGHGANTVSEKIQPLNPAKSILLDTEIEIPGFDTTAHLKIFRLEVPSKGTVDEYSTHGIMIKSGVTIYENSLFGLENHSQSIYISGQIECTKINELIRAHDAADAKNRKDIRLVSRDRDGIQKNHPFTKELRKAVYAVLSPILDELQKENGVQVARGEKLQNAFRDAADSLRNDVNQLMRELEEDPNGPDVNAGAEKDFYLIPPVLKIRKGSTQSVTVRMKKGQQSTLYVDFPSDENERLVGLFVPEDTDWRDHERLDYVQTNFQITALDVLGSSYATVSVGEHKEFLPITVVEPSEREFTPPSELEFSPNRASIAKFKTRKLELIAPLEFSDREVSIEIEELVVGSFPSTVVLRPSAEGRWSRALVPVTVGSVEGVAKVTARMATGEEALALLTVSSDGPSGGTELEFNLLSGTEVDRRVSVAATPGKIVINVQGEHRAFSGVFGNWNPIESKFEEEDSVAARSVLSEVISRALAQHFVSQLSLKRPEEFTDAERIFNRVDEITAKFAQKSYAGMKARD